MVKKLLLSLALIAVPLLAQEASTDFPGGPTDPPCATGEHWVSYNTTLKQYRKCENGVVGPIGILAGSSTTGNGPQGTAYDPERRPDDSTLDTACSNEFKNGADDAASSFSWGNQSSATTTTKGDFMQIEDVNDTGTHAYVCTPSTSVDWTMTAKLTVYTSGNPGNAGLVFIDGGSIASPTTVVGGPIFRRTGSTTGDYLSGTKAAWTTTTWTTIATDTAANAQPAANRFSYCVQARYVNSTQVMTFRIAYDCRNWNWRGTSTRTFTNHPGAAGVGVESPASGTTRVSIQWIRTRIDSAGTSGDYLVGS